MNAYRIVTVARQYTAVVKAHVPFADLPTAERTARAKLADALPKLDVSPTGDCFTLSRMPSDGRIHIEPGVIVERPFLALEDVVTSELPAGRAVHHLLVGPFGRLPEAWPALFAWCGREGLNLEGRFWQIYGPTPVDPTRQETQLYALLAS